MTAIQWTVEVLWPQSQPVTTELRSTEHLKAWLDKEGFCLDHGCPLPEAMVIRRTS